MVLLYKKQKVLLKSNGPNSISKDVLRDENDSWLINCTTQEYLVNVGQDSHFNKFLTPKQKNNFEYEPYWRINLFPLLYFKIVALNCSVEYYDYEIHIKSHEQNQ